MPIAAIFKFLLKTKIGRFLLGVGGGLILLGALSIFLLFQQFLCNPATQWIPGVNCDDDDIVVYEPFSETDMQNLAGEVKDVRASVNAGADVGGDIYRERPIIDSDLDYSGLSGVGGSDFEQLFHEGVDWKENGQDGRYVSYSMDQRGGVVGSTKYLDCSLFIVELYNEILDMNWNTWDNTTRLRDMDDTTHIPLNEVRPGDLVFFYPGPDSTVNHIGMAIGDGQMLHMSSSSDIQIASWQTGYWSDRQRIGLRVTGVDNENEDGVEFEEDEETQDEASGDTGEEELRETNYIDESEIHVRALSNADDVPLMAQSEAITPEFISKSEFDGSNLQRLWSITEIAMQRGENGEAPFDEIYLKAESSDTEWGYDSWMEYTQSLVYDCYFVGDDEGSWFFGVGGNHMPCELTDELLAESKGIVEGDEGYEDVQYVDEEDRYVLTDTHEVTYEDWECEVIPEPEESEENGDNGEGESSEEENGDSNGSEGNRSGDDDGVGPIALSINVLQSLFSFGEDAEAQKPDVVHQRDPDYSCGEGYRRIPTSETETHVSYPNLVDILLEFEDYSLYEMGYTVDPGEFSYREYIEYVLSEMYRDHFGDGSNISNRMTVEKKEFLEPMQGGTYRVSQAFGSSSSGFSEDLRLTTEGESGVPVYASQEGTVMRANPSNEAPVSPQGEDHEEYGGTVVIDGEEGWRIIYGNLDRDKINVRRGWEVTQGQMIGATSQEDVTVKFCEDPDGMFGCNGEGSYEESPWHDPEDDPIDLNLNYGNDIDYSAISESQETYLDSEESIRDARNQEEESRSWTNPDLPSHETRGRLAELYETNTQFFGEGAGLCNRGALANDFESDPNGRTSCGSWQIATGPGIMETFLDFLNDNGYQQAYNELDLHYNVVRDGSSVTALQDPGSFMDAWQRVYEADTEGFFGAQQEFIDMNYLGEMRRRMDNELNIDVYSEPFAIQEVILSTAIQHGPGRATTIVTGAYQSSGGDDHRLWIEHIYAGRTDVFPATAERYRNEQRDAIRMLEDPSYVP